LTGGDGLLEREGWNGWEKNTSEKFFGPAKDIKR
jgi:hypothetical protein